MLKLCVYPVYLAVAAQIGLGQLTTDLKPDAAKAFGQYVAKAQAQMQQQWTSITGPCALDRSPDLRSAVLRGGTEIVPGSRETPVAVPDGLIHDWIGNVFLPHVKPNEVKQALLDFDHHHNFYPDVIRSHTKSASETTVTGYWRLKKDSGVLGAVLDVTTETTCSALSAETSLVCQSRALEIVEIKNADTAKEERLPIGKDQGFLWRMAAFWTLEPVDGGVLAECRTISLSRDVPLGLSFAVRPFLKHIPLEEMTTTLRGIKSALHR